MRALLTQMSAGGRHTATSLPTTPACGTAIVSVLPPAFGAPSAGGTLFPSTATLVPPTVGALASGGLCQSAVTVGPPPAFAAYVGGALSQSAATVAPLPTFGAPVGAARDWFQSAVTMAPTPPQGGSSGWSAEESKRGWRIAGAARKESLPRDGDRMGRSNSPSRVGAGRSRGLVPATVPIRCDVAPADGSITSPARHDHDELMLSLDLGHQPNAVALSPTAARAAFALQDHTVQIWDLGTGLRLHELRGHKQWVKDVAYSRDGQFLASAGADKVVMVWEAFSGKRKATLKGHLLTVNSVSFADDPRLLASGSWDRDVFIWDLEKQDIVLTLSGHADWVHSVCFGPGSCQLASGSSDHTVRVWSASTGRMEKVFAGHRQTVCSVSFAPSGSFLASGSLDCTVRVWRLEDGTLFARLQLDSEVSSVHSVSFAPDGERILVGCQDKMVKLWNARSGEQEKQYHGHSDAVLSVCIAHDGSKAVSCGHDATAKVWRMPAIAHVRASFGDAHKNAVLQRGASPQHRGSPLKAQLPFSPTWQASSPILQHGGPSSMPHQRACSPMPQLRNSFPALQHRAPSPLPHQRVYLPWQPQRASSPVPNGVPAYHLA